MSQKSGSTGAIVEAIDKIEVEGLSGVHNSLAYRVEEIEKHLHNREKWFGAAAVAVGETHIADRMDGAIGEFILTAGNNDFGAWIQVLGSDDTPVTAGMAKFDGHRILVIDTNSTSPFIVQIASGESAALAAKIANEEFTEFPYVAATNSNDSGISDIMSIRVPAGEKIWVRCACVGQNGTTLHFYFGIHEYPG